MRRHRSWAVSVIASVAFLSAGALAQSALDEDRLKAAVIHRFPEFVEWPAMALEGRDSVEVCVAAPASFSSLLGEILSGDTIHGLPFALRQISEISDINTCHVLFASGPSAPTRSLLRRARAKPILTIGDNQSFLDDGGVVQLRVIERRVRFDINATAARDADLKVSSRLLSLARAIRGAPR